MPKGSAAAAFAETDALLPDEKSTTTTTGGGGGGSDEKAAPLEESAIIVTPSTMPKTKRDEDQKRFHHAGHHHHHHHGPAAFLALSTLTVLALGLSCVAEEYIIKQIPGFDFFWFLACSELVVFSALTLAVQKLGCDPNAKIGEEEKEDDCDENEGKWHATKAPKGTLIAGGILIALYTSLGKFAYKYVNYATGTVLKSAKLIPVMVVSVVWLRRKYEPTDYVACFLLVAAACEFGLGEHENSDKTENPSENYAFGVALSLITIGIGAFQSNVTDRILRDYGATVGENMLWTNAVGAVFIFFFVVILEPHAFMFFWETPLYFMLLTFRSVSFFVGAWLYTVIVKYFGAVAAVAVTTTRKLLTVIGSFVFFSSDKPFTTTYAIALGLFIAAVACEYVKHYQKHTNTANAKNLPR